MNSWSGALGNPKRIYEISQPVYEYGLADFLLYTVLMRVLITPYG